VVDFGGGAKFEKAKKEIFARKLPFNNYNMERANSREFDL